MSTTPVLIPVEEYLRTVYRPDCDYVDGEVLERNMGETPHSRLQIFFGFFFRLRQDEWQIEALTEQRLQINEKNYRVPDLMVTGLPEPNQRIVYTPPLLCIEVLSSEDRMSEIQKRLNDYASIGVQSMWVVDPWRGTAFFAGPDAVLHEQKDCLTVPGTSISISVPEIFAELDRLEKRAKRQL
jgi:Uma2 family endonuclease